MLSVQAVVRATNWLIVDELDYDVSNEILRFKRLVLGMNSY